MTPPARNMSSRTLSDLPSIIPFVPPSLQPFLSLQYSLPPRSSLFRHPSGPVLYSKGPKDIYLPITCALTFTLLREVFIRYIFSSFARAYLGKPQIKDPRTRRKAKRKLEHNVLRFAEQGWSFLYCTVFWTFGVITLYQNPNPTSPEQLWGTYPVTHMTGFAKFYYLAQLGWWFHQIYVINTEKRRSDHWQMFGHHVLTIALLTTSYVANFTRVGVLLHVLMDFCDIWLPLAKMLRYIGCFTLCDITFVVFLVGWLASRQFGLAMVIRTCYVHAPEFIPFKWQPSTGHYLTKHTYWGFLTLQSILYALATMWFYLAIIVAVRVVRGQGAQDSRSDDEEDDSPEPPAVEHLNGHANGHANGNGGMDVHVDSDDLDEVPDIASAGAKTTALQNGHQANGIRKR